MKKAVLLYFLFFSCTIFTGGNTLPSNSGSSAPDSQTRLQSLLITLKNAKADSTRVRLLNEMAGILRRSNPDSAILLCSEALSLSQVLSRSLIPVEEKKGQEGLAQTYRLLGILHEMQGKYDPALIYDSLALLVCEKLKDRSAIARIYNNIGVIYGDRRECTRALDYYFKALKMNESIGNKLNIAGNLSNISVQYQDIGDYQKALEYDFKALELSRETGNTSGVGSVLGNMGVIYANMGSYAKAINCDFDALKIEEELNDKLGCAHALGNLGIVYERQKDFSKAIEYYQRSLSLNEKMGNVDGISLCLGNISGLYTIQKKYSLAMAYAQRGLKIAEEVGDPVGRLTQHTGMGHIQEGQGDSALAAGNRLYAINRKYPDALANFSKSLEISKQVGLKLNISEEYENIAGIELKLGKLKEAEAHLLAALAISDSVALLELQKSQHLALSEIYGKLGEPVKSLEQYKLSVSLKDSLYNIEKNKEITRKELNYEFDKKEAALNAELEKKELLNREEARKHRIVLLSGGVFLTMLVILVALIFRNNKQKRRANIQLYQKNQVIEAQKQLVEEKSNKIQESINYAKRLQESLLPAQLLVPGEVKEHFVFFVPKDVVSGDFYWRHESGEHLFFAVVDCTGHGVPGAMMSMMGYDVLESAVKDNGLTDPSRILEYINEQILHKLTGNEEGRGSDGMDITFCRLDKQKSTLTYSGAKNDICVVSGSEMNIFPVDKSSIGDRPGQRYHQQEITLHENDMIYIFTDGYADQNGGAENKKFSRNGLRKLFLEIAALSCDQQLTRLQTEFITWKGAGRQRDDVLLVGFRATGKV